ncbi:MAG: hypothetical protein HYY65_04085, partial [Candidatus Tectomicrobia bacterium]|nr:hypothetical protein [Candidatus Tectomicrobia bacterium]
MRTVKRVGSSLAQTLSVVFLLLATGCVSPQTLQPLAQQNRTNIANYGSNVEAMRIALRKEVALHAALQVH